MFRFHKVFGYEESVVWSVGEISELIRVLYGAQALAPSFRTM